jgi:hypothetical protein
LCRGLIEAPAHQHGRDTHLGDLTLEERRDRRRLRRQGDDPRVTETGPIRRLYLRVIKNLAAFVHRAVTVGERGVDIEVRTSRRKGRVATEAMAEDEDARGVWLTRELIAAEARLELVDDGADVVRAIEGGARERIGRREKVEGGVASVIRADDDPAMGGHELAVGIREQTLPAVAVGVDRERKAALFIDGGCVERDACGQVDVDRAVAQCVAGRVGAGTGRCGVPDAQQELAILARGRGAVGDRDFTVADFIGPGLEELVDVGFGATAGIAAAP